MTVQLNELNEQDLFPSSHWVHPEDVGNRHLVTLTGNVIVNFIGTGSEWRRDRLELLVRFPDIFPPGPEKWFKVEHWASFITINAIANDQQSIDAGWAVDEFGGPGPVTLRSHVRMGAILAVRVWLGSVTA